MTKIGKKLTKNCFEIDENSRIGNIRLKIDNNCFKTIKKVVSKLGIQII